jgi:RNA polymerase sigma-70 factor (ECF subfamily)
VIDASPEPRLDREALLACLQRLAERERAVIVATFFDDSPADAVAADTGLSAGNVRVIRHRALGRLRECMGWKE